MSLPIPRRMRPEPMMPDWLPPPVQRPSDTWLAAHKDIIYDSTQSWLSSDMLLRLGTVAVNYDLRDPLSCTTFGVKVAFKDARGNPQTWRQLPFVQPDLTPYIETIVEKLSACLSASFATRAELREVSAYAKEVTDGVRLSAEGALSASLSAAGLAGNAFSRASEAFSRADSALAAASNASLSALSAVGRADSAYAAAETAGASAAVAVLCAEGAVQMAKNAQDEISGAVETAEAARRIAEGVECKADSAMLSSASALSTAGYALQQALDADNTANESKQLVKEISASSLSGLAAEAARAISAENWLSVMPISMSRLVNGDLPSLFDCGTAEAD